MKKTDEFDDRLKAATAERDAVQSDMRELYMFLFNGREREWDKGLRSKWNDPEEIFDTTAPDANLDFSSDLFSYATPETSPWVEYEVGSAVPEDAREQVLEIVTQREEQLAAAIRSSNYYDVGPQIFQEAGIGLVAANVERPTLTAAIEVEPVPISELFITAGAHGIEDRFRCKMIYGRDVKVLFPEHQPSTKLAKKIEDNKLLPAKWGYWKDHSDPGYPIWKHVAKIEDEIVVPETELGGPGSCPLQIGRFNPIPGTPYGRGPGWLMLPEIRTVNALRQMILNKMDQVVDPALVYVRDGLLDLSTGIEAGMAYPAMPGAADEIREIGGEGNLDYGLFSLEDLRGIIRHGFFRKNEQPGKTPPSATQFSGEETEAIRRMGRPGAAVFNEFVRGFLQRVEFLEVRDRNLEQQIMLGTDVVTITPISPLVRAQNREAVMTAQGIMQMTAETLGPEKAFLLMNGERTMRNVKDKLGDEVVVFNTREEMMQLMQAQQPQQQQPQQQPEPPSG